MSRSRPHAAGFHAAEEARRSRFSPALAGAKLSGVIRADRIAGVVRLLEEECGVRVERTGDARIVLHRAR